MAVAKKKGRYELSRNWVIGSRLAKENGQAFTLANLAPGSLKTSAEDFEKTIVQSIVEEPRRDFRFLAWKDFLGRAREERIKMPASLSASSLTAALRRRLGADSHSPQPLGNGLRFTCPVPVIRARRRLSPRALSHLSRLKVGASRGREARTISGLRHSRCSTATPRASRRASSIRVAFATRRSSVD